jgi:hypothetical protein
MFLDTQNMHTYGFFYHILFWIFWYFEWILKLHICRIIVAMLICYLLFPISEFFIYSLAEFWTLFLRVEIVAP